MTNHQSRPSRFPDGSPKPTELRTPHGPGPAARGPSVLLPKGPDEAPSEAASLPGELHWPPPPAACPSAHAPHALGCLLSPRPALLRPGPPARLPATSLPVARQASTRPFRAARGAAAQVSFLTRAPALRDVPGVSPAASATMTALCSLPFPRGTPCTSVGQHPRRSRPCPSPTHSKRQRDRPLSPTAHAPQRPGGQTGESGSAVLVEKTRPGTRGPAQGLAWQGKPRLRSRLPAASLKRASERDAALGRGGAAGRGGRTYIRLASTASR